MTEQDLLEIKSELEHSEIPKPSQEKLLDACEKQVAKKAVITGHHNAINTEVGLCPVCQGLPLRACDNNYCPNCGQKLDWGE